MARCVLTKLQTQSRPTRRYLEGVMDPTSTDYETIEFVDEAFDLEEEEEESTED